MKALKHEKKARKEAKHSKVFMVKFIKELVGECAYKAVELADGHGARLKLADIHARQRGKVRALNKSPRAELRTLEGVVGRSPQAWNGSFSAVSKPTFASK